MDLQLIGISLIKWLLQGPRKSKLGLQFHTFHNFPRCTLAGGRRDVFHYSSVSTLKISSNQNMIDWGLGRPPVARIF